MRENIHTARTTTCTSQGFWYIWRALYVNADHRYAYRPMDNICLNLDCFKLCGHGEKGIVAICVWCYLLSGLMMLSSLSGLGSCNYHAIHTLIVIVRASCSFLGGSACASGHAEMHWAR